MNKNNIIYIIFTSFSNTVDLSFSHYNIIQYHFPLNCFYAYELKIDSEDIVPGVPPGCFALHSTTLLWLNTALLCTTHHSGKEVQNNSAEALNNEVHIYCIVFVFLKVRSNVLLTDTHLTLSSSTPSLSSSSSQASPLPSLSKSSWPELGRRGQLSWPKETINTLCLHYIRITCLGRRVAMVHQRL